MSVVAIVVVGVVVSVVLSAVLCIAAIKEEAIS